MTVLSAFLLGIALVASLLAARGLLVAYAKRNPYFHLSDYMERFWVIRHNAQKSNWAARAHNIKRPDHDRALHDHPWPNASVVLRRGYWEVVQGALQQALEDGSLESTPHLLAIHRTISSTPGHRLTRAQRAAIAAVGVKWRGAGAIVFRKATMLHRLVVPKGSDAWSLFIMGPKWREWGYQTPSGWVHNVEYTRALGRDA